MERRRRQFTGDDLGFFLLHVTEQVFGATYILFRSAFRILLLHLMGFPYFL